MGTVNIFLGGTGKEIAEDIQDSGDFLGLEISQPVAFDLDAATREGVDLRGFVHPSTATMATVDEVAKTWAKGEVGTHVGPKDKSVPGPATSPEHSLLVAVGKGIAENPSPTAGLYALRAHGLTVFSALFDSSHALAGAGDGNKLRNIIADVVESETHDGRAPRINLVTSTAGGTGAGTVIPLALWLKDAYKDSPLNLIAVTPEAFRTVLRGNPNLEELAYKGHSGTYAMFRELSYFQEVDPLATFSARRLPVTANGLEYTPGTKLFDRVYWFGGREAREPSDAFEEAGTLVRILSTDDAAEELAGKTGAHPLKSVGAITAIEYPKLRLQRKLVSQVLLAAYDRLRSARQGFGEGGTDGGPALLDYASGATERKLGAWLYDQSTASLHLDSREPVAPQAANILADRVVEEAGLENALDAPRGTAIPGDNYDSSETDWKRYVRRVTVGLNALADRNQAKLEGAIPAMRAGEEQACGVWLRTMVFGDDGWLSGEPGDDSRPHGIADVRRRIERLEGEARELEDQVAKDAYSSRLRTPRDLDDDILKLTDKLDKPDERKVSPSLWHIAAGIIAAGVVAGIGVALWPVWEGISSFGDIGSRTAVSEVLVWLAFIALAFIAAVGAKRLVMRGAMKAATLAERRRDAETRLFNAYRERDRVRALQWMLVELRGRDGAPAFFRELRSQVENIRAEVEMLDSLYKDLSDEATRVVDLGDNPAHVSATVGDRIQEDPGIATAIVREVAQRIRVEVTPAPENRVGDLAVRLQPLDTDEESVKAAFADARKVRAAIDRDRGLELIEETEIANSWKNALWGLVNTELAQDLPETFVAALKRYESDGSDSAATRALAGKLNTLRPPRSPSVGLRVHANAPIFRKLYAGSPEIIARFNMALEEPTLDPSVARQLRDYVADSRVVKSLGEQLVLLDLWADDRSPAWAPHVVGNATEADTYRDTYYNIQRSVPLEATAVGSTFTVVPELLAATRIELEGNVDPLAPVVIPRLLGSDLDTTGPTYAELFYLLRARRCLSFDAQGVGPQARTVVRLVLNGKEIGLVEFAPGDVGDDRFFGAGRKAIMAYDAFCDFMRFDGKPQMARRDAQGPFRAARTLNDEWVADPRRLAALQHDAVFQWYEGDVDADCEAMVRVLEEDLKDMDVLTDEGREARRSWEQAMRRLLNGDERRRIRNTLVGATRSS